MNKLLTALQMREADADYIKQSGAPSINLMENAAKAFVGVFCGLIPKRSQPILVVCGTGNNGGDGLAIARLLQCTGYSEIRVLIVATGKDKSPDFLINLQQIESTPIVVRDFTDGDEKSIHEPVIIDAILGSGVNRPVVGRLKNIIDSINQLHKHVIAVDCPSGFVCEGELNEENSVLKASDVVSFQKPKLNFFFPESEHYFEHFHVVDIGLREGFINSLDSDFYLTTPRDISRIYKKRKQFSHKGTYGHALIYTGEEGMSGAALLAAQACVYSGAGLTTVFLPKEGRSALFSRVPEAMALDLEPGEHEALLEGNEEVLERFTSIGIGSGSLFNDYLYGMTLLAKDRIVFDAQALNMLAEDPNRMKYFVFSENNVLTPHMKEFDRLFGKSNCWWDRLQLAITKAKEKKVTIVLKNRYTFIVLPDGRVLINPTGNPGMASGGMGDVLTGIITSFLAQGYSAEEACTLACYIHGRAGDLLAAQGYAVIPASQLIAKLPLVIGEIE